MERGLRKGGNEIREKKSCKVRERRIMEKDKDNRVGEGNEGVRGTDKG